MDNFPGTRPLRAGAVTNPLAGLTVTCDGDHFVLLDRQGVEIAKGGMDAVQSAYATAWIRWVAVEGIGMGFHPDTPADGYEPPLDRDMMDQYDEMIGFSHEHADPYADGLQAWRDAGMIDPDIDDDSQAAGVSPL